MASSPGSEYALAFQRNGVINDASLDVWGRGNGFASAADFTICAWFLIYYVRKPNPLFSYCLPREGKAPTCTSFTMMGESAFEFSVNDYSWQLTDEAGLKLRKKNWNHICAIFEEQEANNKVAYSITVNGEEIASGTEKNNGDDLQGLPAGGFLILGHDVDKYTPSASQLWDQFGFEKMQSFSGALSQLNFWSKKLSPSQMKALAQCSGVYDSDLLNWDDYENSWSLNNTEKLTFSLSDFCKNLPTRKLYMFPELRSNVYADEHCSSLGGSLVVPRNEKENLEVVDIAEDYYQVCKAKQNSGKTIWLGVKAEEGSNDWKTTNGTSVSYFNWKDNAFGNCAYLFTKTGVGNKGKWGDAICSINSVLNLCTLCEFNEPIVEYFILGLCQANTLDRMYTLEYGLGAQDGVKRPFLQGRMNTNIKYNITSKRWELRHLHSPNYALLTDKRATGPDTYPIGRYKWRVFNPECDTIDTEIFLTLSRCARGIRTNTQEFTCDNGFCIPLEQRCDQQKDCTDGSDERECTEVVLPESYENTMPPPNPFNESMPLEVLFNLDITGFENIVMKDMSLRVMMRLNLQWLDSRIQFNNIREDEFKNDVSAHKQEALWAPLISFHTAKTGMTESDPESDRLAIIKRSNKSKYDNDFAWEEARYPGEANYLTHYKRYYAEFPCNFDLRLFPFDEQSCPMEFKMRNAIKAQVVIIPGNIVYKGSKDVVEFLVMNSTVIDVDGKRDTKKVIVHFVRQSGSYITSCFIPTAMLGLLAYSTFFIHIDDFNDRFMGSLTALLVLASMMPVFTGDLPKASYTKLIDMWLLFFIISTTINICIHIIVDWLRKEELEKKRETENNQVRPMTVTEIHNGQKIYPLKKKMERGKRARMIDAKMVNKGFIIAFPIAFIIFIGYMVIQVLTAPSGLKIV